MTPMLSRSLRDSFHTAEQRLMRCFVRLRVGQGEQGTITIVHRGGMRA